MEKTKKNMEILATSFEDIEEAIFKILTKKYFFGLNLITGRSNLRSAVEILVEIVIGIYLFIFLISKSPMNEFPIKELIIAYCVKYAIILIDTVVLIATRVLNFFDVFMNLVDFGFWALCYFVFENYNESGVSDQIGMLYALSICRAVYVLLYYTLSVFVFARDDSVSEFIFY